MKKYITVFNEQNFAKIGILEDFYSLYYQSGDFLSDKPFGSEAEKNIKRIFNAFLKKYWFYFVEDKKYFYLTDRMLGMYKPWLIDGMDKIPMELTYISFGKFFNVFNMCLELIASYYADIELFSDGPAIWNLYCGKEYPAVTLQFRKMEQHFLSMVQKEDDAVNTNISEASSFNTLLIYEVLHLISCNQKNHDVVPDRYAINSKPDDCNIILPIHRCNTCGKLFIGKKTYDVFKKIVDFSSVKILNDSEDFDEINFLLNADKESKLHRNGYNVKKNGLSDAERQKLLIDLYESNTMTYFEICKDLENSIQIFGKRSAYADAVAKWNKDLKFIGDYVKNHNS